MKNYRKIVKEDLAKLRSSSRTMKDIFDEVQTSVCQERDLS